MAVILSGKQQNGDTTRAYSVSCSSKTPDANMRSSYGDTLQVCLVTCVLRNHNNGVKHFFFFFFYNNLASCMDTHNSNLIMLIQRRAPKRGNSKFLNDEKVETLTTS